MKPWNPVGIQINTSILGDLLPSEVLYEYDHEPLIFVTHDPDQELLLSHNLSIIDRTTRYLVAAVDQRIVGELKEGQVDILTALRQPRCWIATVDDRGKVQQVLRIPFESIPKEILPQPGVMLKHEHAPLFKVRLLGDGVGLGRSSASDLRLAAQACESGLRGLARIALDKKKTAGRVPREVRHYSDLPYLFTRCASLEVAFGRPRDRLPGFDDEIFDGMAVLLSDGLLSIREPNATSPSIAGLDTDSSRKLIESIRSLTPPMRGGVNQIEIGGELAGRISGSKVLTRFDRLSCIERIKRTELSSSQQDPFRITGVVEEADQGILGFKLRQLDYKQSRDFTIETEVGFVFEDYLLDRVLDAFNSQERVDVIGKCVDKQFHALDIRVSTNIGISPGNAE